MGMKFSLQFCEPLLELMTSVIFRRSHRLLRFLGGKTDAFFPGAHFSFRSFGGISVPKDRSSEDTRHAACRHSFGALCPEFAVRRNTFGVGTAQTDGSHNNTHKGGIVPRHSRPQKGGQTRPSHVLCARLLRNTGLCAVCPRLLGLTPAESALLGSVIAAVSPAVIVPKMVQLMEEKRGTAKGIPQLILAGASMDDIFVIVLFSAFTAMVQGEGVSASSFVSIPVSIVTGVILGALVGLALYTFFETAFSMGKYIRNSVKLIIMLAFAFLPVSAEEFLKGIIPLSGLLAVTAMAAVIKLKSSKGVSTRLSAKFGKLWIASELILFTLVGAAVDISYTLKAGPLVLVMLCISLIFRACGVFICLLGTKKKKKGKAFLRDSLYPKGYGAGGNRLCALGFGTCVRQHSAFGGRCRHTLYGASRRLRHGHDGPQTFGEKLIKQKTADIRRFLICYFFCTQKTHPST